MPILTFNPGPSKLAEETKRDIVEALELGIPEISHRSKQFSSISADAHAGLRAFLGIPNDCAMFFVASATEAMELSVRNLVRLASAHVTCGRFSELFTEVSASNGKRACAIPTPWGEAPPYDPAAVPRDTELLSITANETSTGVQCGSEAIARMRRGCPDVLLAVDITSIVGMQRFTIADADVWLFSVQKGFGLPAGLGVLVVSPRALARARELAAAGESRAGLFGFPAMEELNRRGCQTVCTPNVLAIFLLARTLQRWNAAGGIDVLERATRAKASAVYAAVAGNPRLRCFVGDAAARSISVPCIAAEPPSIAALHARAEAQGIRLGKGYGKLKDATFRLGLFPALTDEDVARVVDLFRSV